MSELTIDRGGMADDLMPARSPQKPEVSVAPKNDPITAAFLNRQPSMGEITSSLYRALGSPQRNKVSFGEALNNMRAAKLKEAVQLEGIQRGRKADKRADEAASRDGERLQLERSREKRLQKQSQEAIKQARAAARTKQQQRIVDVAEKIGGKKYAGYVLYRVGEMLSEEDMAGPDAERKIQAAAGQAWNEGVKSGDIQVSGNEYKPNYKNIVFPDGSVEMVNVADEQVMGQVRKRGGKIEKGSALSGSVEIPQPDGGTISMKFGDAAKRKAGAVDAIAKSQATMGEIEKTIESLKDTPSAVGISGVVIENVGGLVVQLTRIISEEKADTLGEFIGTARVQRVRTQARALIGKLIAPITGDTSGRYSEKDMQLAQAALQATEPTADMSQIVAALDTVKGIEQRAVARERMKRDGIPDLTSEDGVNTYAQQLTEGGMDPAAVISEIRKLRKQYGVAGG